MLSCCICVFQNNPIVMNKAKDRNNEMSVATHLEEKKWTARK